MSFQSDLRRHQALSKIGKGKKPVNGLAELEKKQNEERLNKLKETGERLKRFVT